MNATAKTPSVGELVGSLVTETGTLLRQEVRLASTEMGQKAKSAALDMGMIGVGGALALAGLLSLIFAVVVALEAFLPMWASALIIGVIAVGGGYALVHRGLQALRGIDPIPEQTLRTLQQDKPWLKEQIR